MTGLGGLPVRPQGRVDPREWAYTWEISSGFFDEEEGDGDDGVGDDEDDAAEVGGLALGLDGLDDDDRDGGDGGLEGAKSQVERRVEGPRDEDLDH